MRSRRAPVAFALLALAATGAPAYGPWLLERLPDRWNPWAPLAIDEPPGPLTRYKLARLDRDPSACRALLATAALAWEPVPDRDTGTGCGFTGAGRIAKTTADVGEPFVLTCPAAVSLALWERHVLQPAAFAHFGERVRRIEHYGSYACRNVYHRAAGPRSRHATADAFDIAGFVLTDGRRIRVREHWDMPGEASATPPAVPPLAAEAAFLRDVRDGACRWFDAVLGPDYNAAHRDHFHFDRGPYRACR